MNISEKMKIKNQLKGNYTDTNLLFQDLDKKRSVLICNFANIGPEKMKVDRKTEKCH